ncbi:hypothetical protein HG536_0E05250 [Torulaspora globosa]|uniref:Smr domain-containing protein n=1 Tax=Torulaspora globosa TaxID=48254 RepID=A0A7G3ZJC8_9SACH|nr:uncharacterized protein HG536_0E05250 [Torulaspora globosa]QLL33614.1 hypothetical protein HG536_0E05250 [Torulaspora globosa]
MSASAAVIGPDRGPLVSNGGDNVRDYNHATDQEYQRLRSLADEAHKRRQQLSNESQAAYKQGDGGRAHQLSEKAKIQQRLAEQYNMDAAEYVFVQNNADSDSDEIDLHGLFVKEAVWILKRRIASGIKAHESHVRVIVGKGVHSQNGLAKIKPAVEELCRDANLRNYLDKKNQGVLIIELESARVPDSWADSAFSTEKPAQTHQANAYHPAQQPQYQQPQHQQPQHQQQNSSGSGDLLAKVFKFLFVCIQKNL